MTENIVNIIASARSHMRDYNLDIDQNIYLLVTRKGRKLWRLRYTLDTRQRTLPLGEWPYVSVDLAKERGYEALARLNMQRNRPAKIAPCAESAANDFTFERLAAEWLERVARDGVGEATLYKHQWLIDKALPWLSGKPVTSILATDIFSVLKSEEAAGRFETVKRLRSTLSRIFTYAVLTRRAERDPCADLRHVLVVPRHRHRPAITNEAGAAELLRAMEGYSGNVSTALALKLLAHLFVRPGELRCAQWGEFSFSRAVWVIPASRMKMKRDHRVPLSHQSLALLARLYELSGHGVYCFPSMRSWERPMSDNTINAALRTLGYSGDRMTAHGFRAMAATLIHETGEFNPDAIDHQLSHVHHDSVRRAYFRGEFWNERVRMMQFWSDMLDDLGRPASSGPKPRYAPVDP